MTLALEVGNIRTMKHALITGTSGCLGSFIAIDLLARGYSVLGVDKVPAVSPELASTAGFSAKECDLSDPRATRALFDQCQAESAVFDVVINSIGILFSAPTVTLQDGRLAVHSFEMWDKVIATNLSAPFYVCACAAKQMIAAKKRGVLINISSICASGNPGQAAYSAAKAGLNGLTMALAKELGPFGIRVASLAPGFIDTPSTHGAMSAELLGRVRKNTPLRRLGTHDEIVGAVRFIVENEYFTGRTLQIDGGLTI